jgi:7-cyano-7-deazaguanine reductase
MAAFMNRPADQGIPLGRQARYKDTYDPFLLFAIPRKEARKALGIQGALPFSGVDIWNAYELSWLDAFGKPCVAAARITFPCDSGNMIESKSLKLYLNSFNFTRFKSVEKVREVITTDLSQNALADVTVDLVMPGSFAMMIICDPPGTCIDGLDLENEVNTCEYRPDYLKIVPGTAEETLFSNLLRTRCPVTGQPDWATVMIRYKGPAMDHAGLLQYLISLRRHSGFHENCVEIMFMDILHRCRPDHLSVYAGFTRRGGLDINPGRATGEQNFPNIRLARQ